MSYDELSEVLASENGTRTITAFPDGSVDVYYSAYDVHGDPIEDRAGFAERLLEDPPAFPVTRESTEPGGQAVNTAIQADALGDSVTLFGHLDHPAFEGLGFETRSMGEPSRVAVYPFDEDVLFAERSPELAAWTLGDLRTAAADFEGALEADVVSCGNWVSVTGMTEVLRGLAVESIDGNAFLFDPGAISIRSEGAIHELFSALAGLESTYDVVLSVNGTELAAGAAALGFSGGRRERLSALRSETGISAAVLHAGSAAVAATPEGVVSVPTRPVEEPVRETGAGDRFDAGLAYALARDWDWDLALALGNACAAHYVATARTADRETLRARLRS
ncbi:PfkB family carbohydrate kinase [Halalkalicoccus jeotgali]|uniref:Uncharacterized protein n=1 Tax=Halalkalicoccus jeotgali (strain DSM 18796 / CECT 7217 / JCM 14584 / KCTC 4019 / B3) TaxID=795797 RepID=D8J306_HALJB|nr:PfkB family carbohydrate kinase [Halalkalicoccus jeotgali]ADJ15113.1 hypothetical protein HacjB3_08650 [Halalkalicoccus jeotgali B3]ELY34867.1 hypothetical protein C497_14047 [Halalkalicoccus jeotgali B3]